MNKFSLENLSELQDSYNELKASGALLIEKIKDKVELSPPIMPIDSGFSFVNFKILDIEYKAVIELQSNFASNYQGTLKVEIKRKGEFRYLSLSAYTSKHGVSFNPVWIKEGKGPFEDLDSLITSIFDSIIADQNRNAYLIALD